MAEFPEPWRPWRSFLRDMERLFDDFRREIDRRFGLPAEEGVRQPFADVIDTGKEFKVVAELPGVPKENIEINVTQNEIEISAEAKEERKEEGRGYIRQERGYSKFYRRIALPEEIVPEKSRASVNHGILEIVLPKKAPEARKHRIKVE